MRSSVRTPRSLAATVVVLLLLGGACGGRQAEQSAGDAADEPASSGASAGGGASPSPAEAAGEGGSWDEQTLAPSMLAAMAEHETARFTVTTTGGGAVLAEAEGSMAFRDGVQDMVMRLSGEDLGVQQMEIRMVDSVVYLSMPPMTPKGKFFEVAAEDPGSPFAGMVDGMRVDPRESVKAFRAGVREMAFLGIETVDGQRLEHHRLTLDFAAAAEAQGLPPVSGAPETVEYHLWLDDDALPRRMELDAVQMGMVMELSDWGEPVRIQAPPPRKIVPAPGESGS